VKAFSDKFDTYVLFAQTPDCDALDRVVSLIASNKIRFILDAMSSAAIAKEPRFSLAQPCNPPHAENISLESLSKYKRRYGEYFAGIRLMEVYSMNMDVHQGMFHDVKFAQRWKERWPQDGNVFQPSIVESYVRWAANQGMFVDFSDWFWSFDHGKMPPDIEQQKYERQLQSIIRRHPNVVIVTYANNEPGMRSRSQKENWVRAFQSYEEYGARGFGLSDQDWLYAVPNTFNEMNCPVEELIDWAKLAWSRGAVMVQLEPVWYWWDFPRGSVQNDYGQYKYERQRGSRKENLEKFAAAFNVKLPNK
jgi:hypothetical protein